MTYTQVDRVIDEGELTDPLTDENKIYFLVKWNGLFYDSSTWETEDDLRQVSGWKLSWFFKRTGPLHVTFPQIDSVKIDEFHARRQIPQHKLVNPPPRPIPMVTPFTHYDRSPM